MEDELEDSMVEEESGTDELDCNFTLELEATTDELDPLTDELEDLTTEDESGTDELDCNFTLELETTGDELDTPTDELEDLTTEDEFICSLLKDISTEDELSSSDSKLLFPLSLSQAARIRATATTPNNAIRCFCFIFSPSLNHHSSQNSYFRFACRRPLLKRGGVNRPT